MWVHLLLINSHSQTSMYFLFYTYLLYPYCIKWKDKTVTQTIVIAVVRVHLPENPATRLATVGNNIDI